MEAAIGLTAIIIASISIVMSLASLAMSIGVRLSTHRIEWKPVKAFDPFEDAEGEKKLVEEDDEKLLEEALALQRKSKKKQETDPLSEILETNNF
jgi:hypothetical protein